MPLPRHDERPLPSRRALREAERTRAAGSGARTAHSQPQPILGRCPAPAVVTEPTVVVGPTVPTVSLVPSVVVQGQATEHVLEGGDDAWAQDVTPRPTPVAARVAVESAGVPTPRDPRAAWRRLPQLLVVGSLVAATIGYVSTGDPTAAAGEVRAYERAEQPVSAEAATLVAGAEDPSGMVAGEDGLLRVQVDEASRAAERTLLPGCDGVPPETPQDNGRIDEGTLCTLWDGTTRIRADAAVALTVLNEKYRTRFGEDICLTDGYRSYGAQVSLRSRKPGLAAEPGTSEHGFGLAVDMCGGVESQGEGYWWLAENAATFGYENPPWAQRGGGGPFEPWHWEYAAGQW